MTYRANRKHAHTVSSVTHHSAKKKKKDLNTTARLKIEMKDARDRALGREEIDGEDVDFYSVQSDVGYDKAAIVTVRYVNIMREEKGTKREPGARLRTT